MSLRVIQLKPNPTGKDRSRYGSPSAAQLGGEWVDIRNISSGSVSLEGIELYHLAYGHPGSQPEWRKIMDFRGSLPAGKVMRVHSGQTRDVSVLYPVDRIGADFHLFTGRDSYVWNNAEGDTAGLWFAVSKTWADQAAYDPYPPEGVILVRSGSKLVPAGAALRV